MKALNVGFLVREIVFSLAAKSLATAGAVHLAVLAG
jgi:hypothetical protein